MIGRRPLIVLIVLLSMFGPISTDMYLSGLPQMMSDFGTTESVMNISLYLFMLVFALSILILGPTSDKYGRRKVLMISMIIYASASFFCSLCNDVILFIIVRGIQAIGAGGGLTAAFALIKDCFKGREMSHILSITAAIGVLGPILSPVLGALMISLIDWRATFWIPGIISLTCLVLAIGLPSTIPEERQASVISAVKSVLTIARNTNFLMFTVMMTVFTSSLLAYISVSSYVYQNGFGFDPNQYSAMLAIGCISGLVISIIMRKILINAPRKMLALMFLLGVLGLAIMTFVAKEGWMFFLAGIIPYAAICTTTRSFGFGILMNNHEGNNGAVSSILNFSTFLLAFFGMLIASSFPNDAFIYGVATVMAISCTVFFTLWMILRHRGYPLAGLEA